jgi:hypothetical protein
VVQNQIKSDLQWLSVRKHRDLRRQRVTRRFWRIVDLKMEPFKPEFAGKMNFYLSAVDDRMRGPQDEPTIGLLLCRDKNRITVEYALRTWPNRLALPNGAPDW